ncbi:proline-rich receptor-like protein kinase PERK2 [Iris pallida]|uniref:Proline-rich receptor-like protein kinase PERK2 n=1 Tax=Iris pallida TaxID=29817 RepID=A0AAX6IM48_IRIPA|nr:proline-rich receptor-like protein kinase PERK2 [Iris pallida]
MLGRSHGRGGGVLDRRGRGHDGGSEGAAKGAVRFPLSYSLRVLIWGNGMDDRGGAWRTLGRSWSGLVVSGVRAGCIADVCGMGGDGEIDGGDRDGSG